MSCYVYIYNFISPRTLPVITCSIWILILDVYGYICLCCYCDCVSRTGHFCYLLEIIFAQSLAFLPKFNQNLYVSLLFLVSIPVITSNQNRFLQFYLRGGGLHKYPQYVSGVLFSKLLFYHSCSLLFLVLFSLSPEQYGPTLLYLNFKTSRTEIISTKQSKLEYCSGRCALLLYKCTVSIKSNFVNYYV